MQIKKAWEVTWEEIEELNGSPKEVAVVDFRGYLIVSKDRRLVGSHKSLAKILYSESLQYALDKEIEIDQRVLAAACLAAPLPSIEAEVRVEEPKTEDESLFSFA